MNRNTVHRRHFRRWDPERLPQRLALDIRHAFEPRRPTAHHPFEVLPLAPISADEARIVQLRRHSESRPQGSDSL